MNTLLIIWCLFSLFSKVKYFFKSKLRKVTDTFKTLIELKKIKQSESEKSYKIMITIVSCVILMFKMEKIILSIKVIDNSYFFIYSLIMILLNSLFFIKVSKLWEMEYDPKEENDIIASYLSLKDSFYIIYISYDIVSLYLSLMGGGTIWK